MTSNIIIIGLIIIAVLDTLIGNRIFPGKVEVLKHNSKYYIVRKQHRFLLFLWVWRYLRTANYYSVNRRIDDFTSYLHSELLDESSAIKMAMIFSNKLKISEEEDIIWSSKDKKKIENNKEDILKLIPELTEAVRKGNDKQEELILEKLQRC